MAQLQPIVLVGGRSSRFGRDKLREVVARGEWLIDRPIRALREVFGPRVAVVGDCHPDIAARADLVIQDVYPGVGPIGGIVSALGHPLGQRGVFVLAGDLPDITGVDVGVVLAAADVHADAWAVLARTGRLEPCVGVYRPGAFVMLRERVVGAQANRLYDALPAERVVTVAVEAAHLRNVNMPADIE